MKLITAELKQYRAAATAIPENNLLPVLSYLKITPGAITKSSLNSFLTMAITSDMSVLIDEKILMNAVSYTQAAELEVRIEGTSVILSDGTTEWSSPTEDIINFPAAQYPEGEGEVLSPELLKDLGIAAACNEVDTQNLYRSHVIVGNDLLGGTDGIIAYMKKYPGIQEMVITKEVAAVVSKITDEVIYKADESYHFFKAGPFKYGFSKDSATLIDYRPFLVELEGLPNFVLPKAQLIAFNDMAVSTSKMQFAFGTISTPQANLININVTEANYSMGIKKHMTCQGKIDVPFSYNCGILNRLLKALPADLLTFTPVGTKMYITSPAHSFISLIIQIVL